MQTHTSCRIGSGRKMPAGRFVHFSACAHLGTANLNRPSVQALPEMNGSVKTHKCQRACHSGSTHTCVKPAYRGISAHFPQGTSCLSGFSESNKHATGVLLVFSKGFRVRPMQMTPRLETTKFDEKVSESHGRISSEGCKGGLFEFGM